jgi:hypothetical protein
MSETLAKPTYLGLVASTESSGAINLGLARVLVA